MKISQAVFAGALAVSLAAPASAHTTEPSRSAIEVSTRDVRWTVRVRACDLAHALATGRDPIELAHDPRVTAYARSRIAVLDEDGQAQAIETASAHPEGAIIRIELRFRAPEGKTIWLRSGFLLDADGEHKDFAKITRTGSAEESGVAFGAAVQVIEVSRTASLSSASTSTPIKLGAIGAVLLGTLTLGFAVFPGKVRQRAGGSS